MRDRVLAGGARAMANVRSRTAAPPPPPAALPLPPPRRSLRHRAALSRARRVRNAAHRIPRSGCCWRDQREDLGVGPSVRATTKEAHPLAWSIACGGLRVGRTRRGQHGPWQRAARRRARSCSSKAPRAAAAVHVVHGTWWRGCWGRASGGPAAEDISARPKYKGRLCACTARSCSSAGGEREALVPSARCGGGERRAGGGGHRRATQAQGPPSTRHRIGCLACVPPPPSAGWQSDQNGLPSFTTRRTLRPHVETY